MAPLSFDAYLAEIVHQTDLLASHVAGADPTTPVPSTPGWDLGRLLHHLGSGHRWAAEIVRTPAAEPPSDRALRVAPDEYRADYGPWLAEGARELAGALAEAGPEAERWSPVPGAKVFFWALRFTHETLVHRADAALALGKPFEVAPEVAADALDEWMVLTSHPLMLRLHPERRELLGPGRTLHLHATDTDAEWLVDLTGDAPTWRRAHEEAAVAVRGAVVDLLLVVYRRRKPDEVPAEVHGDRGLLDSWLERVSFG